MIISSLYTMLQEKDEKVNDRADDPDIADNEETDEKNQDKKTVDDDEEPEDEDELFNDVDNEVNDSDTTDDGISDNDSDISTDDDNTSPDDNSDTTDDVSTDDSTEEDAKYIKIKDANKKKKLAMDIINLYDYYGKIIYRLEDINNLSYDESKILDDCIKKLNDTRKLMYTYIQTMYRSDSYERALSVYINFKIPIKFTEEIITKIAEKRNNI